MSIENIRELLSEYTDANIAMHDAQHAMQKMEHKLIQLFMEASDMHAFKLNWSYVRRMAKEY